MQPETPLDPEHQKSPPRVARLEKASKDGLEWYRARTQVREMGREMGRELGNWATLLPTPKGHTGSELEGRAGNRLSGIKLRLTTDKRKEARCSAFVLTNGDGETLRRPRLTTAHAARSAEARALMVLEVKGAGSASWSAQAQRVAGEIFRISWLCLYFCPRYRCPLSQALFRG